MASITLRGRAWLTHIAPGTPPGGVFDLTLTAAAVGEPWRPVSATSRRELPADAPPPTRPPPLRGDDDDDGCGGGGCGGGGEDGSSGDRGGGGEGGSGHGDGRGRSNSSNSGGGDGTAGGRRDEVVGDVPLGDVTLTMPGVLTGREVFSVALTQDGADPPGGACAVWVSSTPTPVEVPWHKRGYAGRLSLDVAVVEG